MAVWGKLICGLRPNLSDSSRVLYKTLGSIQNHFHPNNPFWKKMNVFRVTLCLCTLCTVSISLFSFIIFLVWKAHLLKHTHILSCRLHYLILIKITALDWMLLSRADRRDEGKEDKGKKDKPLWHNRKTGTQNQRSMWRNQSKICKRWKDTGGQNTLFTSKHFFQVMEFMSYMCFLIKFWRNSV